MQEQYNDNAERELFLREHIKELQSVNKKMSQLVVLKEELTEKIIGAVGHEHDGQKSYTYQNWKIEVKTPFVYSLNKKKYESGEFSIPEEFNPIKTSVAYTIDKKRCDEIMERAPIDIIDSLVELIDKKPGKSAVTIKERVS